MKIGSDCSGACVDCSCHYIGGCIAGHGDDHFSRMSVITADMIILNINGYFNEYQINKAKKWLDENM